jgi:hypothetical protein
MYLIDQKHMTAQLFGKGTHPDKMPVSIIAFSVRYDGRKA